MKNETDINKELIENGDSETLKTVAERYEKLGDLDNAARWHEYADRAKAKQDKINSELKTKLDELTKKYLYDSANICVSKELASIYEQMRDYENAYKFYTYAFELSGRKDEELEKHAENMRQKLLEREKFKTEAALENEKEELYKKAKDAQIKKAIGSNPHCINGVGDWVKKYTKNGQWEISDKELEKMRNKSNGLADYIEIFGKKPLEAMEVELSSAFNPAIKNAKNNAKATVDAVNDDLTRHFTDSCKEEEEETQNVCQHVSKAFVRGDITSEEAADILNRKNEKTLDELLPDAITDRHLSQSFEYLAEQIAQGVMDGAITPEEANDFLDGKGKMSDNIMAYLATAKERQRNTVEEDFNSDEWKEKRENWNGLSEYLSKYRPTCQWQPNKGVFPDYEYSFLLDDGKTHTVSGRTLVDWVNSITNEYVIIETANDKFKLFVKEKRNSSLAEAFDTAWHDLLIPRGIFNIGEGVDITYDKKAVESIEPITAFGASENTYTVHYKNGDTVNVKVGFPITTQEEAVEAKVDPLIEFFQLPKDEVIHIIETNLTLGSMWGLESFALDTPHHRYGFLVARTEEQAEKAFRASAMQKLFEQPAETLAKVCGADKELIVKLKNGNHRSAIYGIMEATNSFERYYDEIKRQYGRGHWLAKDGNEIKMDCGYYLYFH